MKIQHGFAFSLLIAGLTSCPQPIKSNTVYDIIATDARLSSLKASLSPAQVAFLSDNSRTLTVFAPQNSAFENAAFAGLTSPKPSGKSLENVINFNILPQSLDLAALKKTINPNNPLGELGTVVNTLATEVYVSLDGTRVFIDSGYYDDGFLDTYAVTIPEIVVPDIRGSNGVVHITDDLLLNATLAETTFEAIARVGEPTFKTQLANLGTFTDLRLNGAFTVFLPENPDFKSLPITQRNCLATNAAVLQKVLNHNILDGQFLSADLEAKTSVLTKNGDSITITKVAGQLLLNGIALKANDPNGTQWRDWIVRNGVTHIIDGLLIPSNVNLTSCTITGG